MRSARHTMTRQQDGKRPRERTRLPLKTVTIVLTEAGYRCAVPTCRGILALDMHHIWEVSADGGDEPANLIALCPTCHALYHRGTISRDSIYAWKSMLVAIGRAFDLEAIDRLLFLDICSERRPILPPRGPGQAESSEDEDYLIVSGDGLLHYSRLIAAGLATMKMKENNGWALVTYAVHISPVGHQLIQAWKQGDRTAIEAALAQQTFRPDAKGAPVEISN